VATFPGRGAPILVGALLTRDRSKLRIWNDPGSAAHRYALHRVREKSEDCSFGGALLSAED
jgi:hypothetical protein